MTSLAMLPGTFEFRPFAKGDVACGIEDCQFIPWRNHTLALSLSKGEAAI
jgi:hypothetical protein